MPIEISGVSELAARFGALPAALRAELKPAILNAANIVADQAKANAAYSTRIPGAISVSARLSSRGGAVISVNADDAPEARVLELGNTGGRSTDFRHPVFGNTDAWVTQPEQPFLFPALRDKRDEARNVIAEAVAAVNKASGF